MKKSAINIPKVPNLRFPGFEGEWEVKRLGEVVKIYDGTHQTPNYLASGIPFYSVEHVTANQFENTKYISLEVFEKENKRVKLEKGDILMTRIGSIGIAKYIDWNIKASFYVSLALIKQSDKINNRYISHFIKTIFFQSELWKRTIHVAFPKKINLGEIGECLIKHPSFPEQQKIASFLSLIDEKNLTQNKIIEELKLLKSTLRNLLFQRTINEENEAISIKDILEYEQPTKYLVSDTNYLSDKTLIPVLTANKAFILGYTNEHFGIYDQNECIIFDDFTMDLKYVDFSFKVKSSAIKILKPKPNVNLRFVFEYFSFLNLQSGEHKRHYISEIEPMKIAMPDSFTQNTIAKALLKVDEKSDIERSLFDLYSQQKQYLLKNLFI